MFVVVLQRKYTSVQITNPPWEIVTTSSLAPSKNSTSVEGGYDGKPSWLSWQVVDELEQSRHLVLFSRSDPGFFFFFFFCLTWRSTFPPRRVSERWEIFTMSSLAPSKNSISVKGGYDGNPFLLPGQMLDELEQSRHLVLFPGPIWGFFRVTCSSTFPSTVGVRTMRNGADLWIDMPSSFEGVVTMVACCILYFVCTSPTCNPCRGALWLVTCNPRPQLVPTILRITQPIADKIFCVSLCFLKSSLW
jgi:hypothetical protein